MMEMPIAGVEGHDRRKGNYNRRRSLRIIGGYTSEANWRERACDRKRECRKQHL